MTGQTPPADPYRSVAEQYVKLVLAVIGIGTYGLRAAFVVTLRGQPPPPVARLLPHIGPAVLAAIAVPALVAPAGAVSAAATLPSLGAA